MPSDPRPRDVVRTFLAGRTPPWSWLLPVATAIAACVTFVGGVLGGPADTGVQVAWLFASAVGVVVTAALPFGRDWARRADLEAAELRVTLRNALQPLAESVAALPAMDPADRRAALEKVATYGAAALTLVLDGVPGLRAVVYQLNEPGDRMVCVAYHGRGGRLPRDFSAENSRGRDAIALARGARTLFIEDLAVARPEAYGGSGRDYATFISVSIHDRENAYGMLTVDAPTAGSLVAVDVHLLEVVAHLLAIAFATAAASAP